MRSCWKYDCKVSELHEIQMQLTKLVHIIQPTFLIVLIGFSLIICLY